MAKTQKPPKRRRLRDKKLLIVGGIALGSLVGCDDAADEDPNEEVHGEGEVDQDDEGDGDQSDEFMVPVGNLLPAPEIEDDVTLEEPTLAEEPPTEG